MSKRICWVSCLCAVFAIALQAQTFKTIVTFNQTNGQDVFGPPIEATDHNLYGATVFGGASNDGAIYKLTPKGVYKVLYSFCSQSGCADGVNPAWLMQAADGDFYGTTSAGGENGAGTIFKITAAGQFTLLYTFCSDAGCTDGSEPQSSLVQTSDGNFYGTTISGGAYGNGTVFTFSAANGLTTLYSFCANTGCTDGSFPFIGLTLAKDGNFYGTTAEGGNHSATSCPIDGCGTVFKITPSGELTTLYSFCAESNCSDGAIPQGLLVQGKDGNLYGTTDNGGGENSGTIYKVSLQGNFTTMHSFCESGICNDGLDPIAGVIQATNGNFYGSAYLGGTGGWGTVFQMTPAGKFTVLHNFDGKADGSYLAASVFQASNGSLLGGTEGGGDDNCDAPDGCGVIFMISKKAASEAASEDSTQGTDSGSHMIVNAPANPRPSNGRRFARY
jgi:uncharacterized repeat protein (TIGR03803 family)